MSAPLELSKLGMSPGSVPVFQAADLIRMGRAPEVPFSVRCDGGDEVVVKRLLRVLPGKRIVGEALWRQQPVLAKVFFGHRDERYWVRERRGVVSLSAANLPVPELQSTGKLVGGGYVLLSEFLPDAVTLAERWASVEQLDAGDSKALEVLQPAFGLLGQLHAAGLIQSDLHLGNFLECRGRLFLIDGDGVRCVNRRDADRQALNNLALLIAQLPLVWESSVDALKAAYEAGQDSIRPDSGRLLKAVEQARTKRLNQFLDKTLRDCTQFSVRQTFSRFASVVRGEADRLSAIVDAPDKAMVNAELLKDGGTCTVARVESYGVPVVIKRYNLKNFRHAISRLWRPSRAWHSWLAGHRLAFFGIATPAPLAVIEERFGPFRRRAFLLTEFCPGDNLLLHLSPSREPAPPEAAAILKLFQMLFRLQISHGDMKATNLLWGGGRLVLIDLDALVQHRSRAAFERCWARDRARFLKNWPENSALHRWLDAKLPNI